MMDPQTWWHQFRQSFVECVRETDTATLAAAWKSCPDRTTFYVEDLLPKIARKLDLGFRKERPFRIDGIFWKKGGQTTDVPVIYLESENIATSSHDEVYKLCCVHSPLKVLIVCTEWEDVHWKKKITDGHWHYQIEDFHQEVGLSGYFAFIIAAWDETLKFHSYVLDDQAVLVEDRVLLEL